MYWLLAVAAWRMRVMTSSSDETAAAALRRATFICQKKIPKDHTGGTITSSRPTIIRRAASDAPLVFILSFIILHVRLIHVRKTNDRTAL
mmetsp:Transcript_782/g.1722  ORF Transcript_782/g.1722 Transcript_782/m.1722 type:complete len:90 (+) Transcript_782:66-335(+)